MSAAKSSKTLLLDSSVNAGRTGIFSVLACLWTLSGKVSHLRLMHRLQVSVIIPCSGV